MNSLKTLAAALLLTLVAFATQDASLTPKAIEAALAAKPTGEQAEMLAAQLRKTFGPDIGNLAKLPGPKIDELSVAWAIEVPNAPAAPKVVSDAGKFSFALSRVGTTDVYAG